MENRIKRALEIADIYRTENFFELPLLLICRDSSNKELVITGSFRKKHEAQDQKTFCAMMRTVFCLKDIVSYDLVVRPTIDSSELQMTKNLLTIVSVDPDQVRSKFFEIDKNQTIPYEEEIPVEGMFTQLLPSSSERASIHTISPKFRESVLIYLKACTFTFQERTEEYYMSTTEKLRRAFA